MSPLFYYNIFSLSKHYPKSLRYAIIKARPKLDEQECEIEFVRSYSDTVFLIRNELLEAIVTVVNFSPQKVGVIMRIIFMGTPDFAGNVLKKLIDEQHEIVLVVSQPDRPVGRKKELRPTPVKQVALDYNIPVFQPEKIRTDYDEIIAANPDLIITAAYGQIVPKVVLDAPRLGCINVHASLLPKYRGGAPIHQAIIDGEPETGVTIMYMDVGLDTGDMISQISTPITDDDDTGILFERLSQLGSDLLIATLPSIEAGTNDRVAQDESQVTYAYNITREQELINWQRSARVIFNHIRGLNPFPTAYTTINEHNVKVFKAEIIGGKASDAGTIIAVSTDGIDISCGDGAILRITELQLAGKKRMPIRDLLNGDHPFVVGAKFD